MGLDELKRAAAAAAADLVEPGMRIGLGTGSTASHFIRLLGQRVAQGLAIEAVATSVASERLAREVGIPMLTFDLLGELDLTVDGADEADGQLNLIKGGGGALLREKIVAYHSRRLVIIGDHHKLVQRLGAFPLPVEVVPFWWQATARAIGRLQVKPRLRYDRDAPFRSDNGNFILDCPFGSIEDPRVLARELDAIPGVVESGLFLGMADQGFFAGPDGIVLIEGDRARSG
jgi:ribose 5-phosphate isomerase A